MSTPADPSAKKSAGQTHKIVTISNRLGLHARAAARFVQVAAAYDAEITVTRNGTAVSGSSILGLMMLAAGPGQEILIEASGPDGAAALDALATLVERRFDED
ncbi:MAG: HPr family phosphocarrier protein [Alphaproteobacteria bacterium]|nr:HPr family phosphocarrier protein [Alphaproteobacteria bacterium]